MRTIVINAALSSILIYNHDILSEREILYSKLKDDNNTHSYIEANAKNSCLRTRKWLSVIDECEFIVNFSCQAKLFFFLLLILYSKFYFSYFMICHVPIKILSFHKQIVSFRYCVMVWFDLLPWDCETCTEENLLNRFMLA